MEPFGKALEVVAGVMRDGAATHPDNDWCAGPGVPHRPCRGALRLWREGDQRQDHLSHAATLLLMALAIRELA